MTMQELFARALLARGERLVKRTFRYEVYSREAGGFYYLGRAGALRYGPTVQGSRPVSQAFKDKLLGIAETKAQLPIENTATEGSEWPWKPGEK